MISRVSAEFESPELAELALNKVRERVSEIYSSGLMYNRISDRALSLRNGSIYTVIPTAVTTHNYITAVIESPSTEDVIPEPSRRRNTKLYVICSSDKASEVSGIFTALGGLGVKTEI